MTKRFYVTMTWHDWPEGGSYGTVVEAEDHAAAETLVRREMAASYSEGYFEDEEFDEEGQIQEILKLYSDSWHVVDCFDLDKFIERHQK